ncbi:hypothetical protein Tco_1334120 [Tanacetum coccineum]
MSKYVEFTSIRCATVKLWRMEEIDLMLLYSAWRLDQWRVQKKGQKTEKPINMHRKGKIWNADIRLLLDLNVLLTLCHTPSYPTKNQWWLKGKAGKARALGP